MNSTQTTTGTNPPMSNQPPSFMASFTPILLMIFVFYFLMIRPQQKRENKKRAMQDSLKRGDKIVTLSGIIGTVHKVISKDEISVEIAEGVRIRMLKSSVAELLDKNSSLGRISAAEDQEEQNSKVK